MPVTAQRQSIIELIEEDIEDVASGYPLAELGDAFERLTRNFQALAVCNLLLTADPADFYRNLFMSGYTRGYFLRRSREEDSWEGYLEISRTESFFDVVATGRLELAHEIDRLSPDSWIPDGGYEDDYCFHQFCYVYVRDLTNPDRTLLRSVADRFEQCATNDSAWRLAVCESLLTRDESAFEESFAGLLEAREEKVAELQPSSGDDPGFFARGAVYLEGLAVLRIASAVGLVVEEEYPLCPGIARGELRGTGPDDIYVEVDRFRRE